MTRPHALPRKPTSTTSSPFPAFELRLPITRVLACANMARADKAMVDAVQSFLSFRQGRSVSLVETMHALVHLALGNARHPLLAGFEPPAYLVEDASSSA